VYKVPQDVEADDKLIGPFSFRQFIYLIIVALSCALAWGLGQLFIPLAIIPLPVIIFFGAIALPLRKDQPMEVYMAAMVSFYLKPRKRLWEADGIESLIEITVPKVIEIQRTKNLSQNEAQERFGYLAEIVDSQGWAVRGQGVQAPNSAMNTDVYFEAQQAVDILDSSNGVAQSFTQMIDQEDVKRRQELIDRMHQVPAADTPVVAAATTNPYNFFSSSNDAAQAVPVTPRPVVSEPPILSAVADPAVPTYDPYPTDIQQTVINPIVTPTNPTPIIVQPPELPPENASEKVVTPAIMNLANNADLSIETIAREANRINREQDMSEEVVISLR
jgi:hypothetical protein